MNDARQFAELFIDFDFLRRVAAHRLRVSALICRSLEYLVRDSAFESFSSGIVSVVYADSRESITEFMVSKGTTPRVKVIRETPTSPSKRRHVRT